ncbi:OsmC family protein [Noviherbaspirillum sedimenti]|uniref:OsmC family peroxiredoxin n=1 Tax=Noviherbaspirillum sedimenti TaxID=2320865 RepID=A0A3A3FZ49_9BURK|nr:OsmC family protein [Noviherbaspirillum sedimenti]RJG00994.1 OsmC family peroxiredoxin [Noviherbaspirillum sedimenti]
MFTATSALTRQTGRYLLSARDQHLVADATQSRGGPGEAWSAGELLLSALLTCANAVIQSVALERNIALLDARIDGSCEADPERQGHYAHIRLDIQLDGPSQEEAEELVFAFTAVCPIYGSLSRGAPVSLALNGKSR